MSEIILYLHVISGLTSVLTSLSTISIKLNKLAVFFWPSISLVSVTGIGLMFTGVSLARVCVSGVLLTVVLVFIRKVSNRKLAVEKA